MLRVGYRVSSYLGIGARAMLPVKAADIRAAQGAADVRRSAARRGARAATSSSASRWSPIAEGGMPIAATFAGRPRSPFVGYPRDRDTDTLSGCRDMSSDRQPSALRPDVLGGEFAGRGRLFGNDVASGRLVGIATLSFGVTLP